MIKMKTKTLIKTGEKKIDKLFTDLVELRNFFMEQKENSLFFRASLNGLYEKSEEIRQFLHNSQKDIVDKYNEIAYKILEPSQPTGLTKENALSMYKKLIDSINANDDAYIEFNKKVPYTHAIKINMLQNEMQKLRVYHQYLFEVEKNVREILAELNERIMEVNSRLAKEVDGDK